MVRRLMEAGPLEYAQLVDLFEAVGDGAGVAARGNREPCRRPRTSSGPEACPGSAPGPGPASDALASHDR